MFNRKIIFSTILGAVLGVMVSIPIFAFSDAASFDTQDRARFIAESGNALSVGTAGTSDDIKVINGGTHKWSWQGADGDLVPETDGNVDIGSSSVDIDNIFVEDFTADTATLDGDLTYTPTTMLFKSDSSDAADNSKVSLASGATAANTRGAFIDLFGNEHATTPGDVTLEAGDISGGEVTITAANSTNGKVNIDAGGVAGIDVETDGDVVAATGEVEINATGKSIRIETGTAASACIGEATANGTTAVTVTTTCSTTGSHIFISRTSAVAAGVTEPGCWATNIQNGVSFDLDCNDAAENSTFKWWIIHEAP